MKSYTKLTPEGVRDVLFEECRARARTREKLADIFTRRGYQEAVTPGLEYFDVFNLSGAAIPQQDMYKSTDGAGRLLVFRPDSTLPIARMAAARLQNRRRPIRLYYCQNVYRSRPALSGKSHELAQMGVELLGAAGLRADLEVICTAVEALEAVAPGFRIELGHAGVFQRLAGRLEVSPERREEIRATIEAKNYGALDSLLDPLGTSPAAEAVRTLPRMFGGEEVLAQAEAWNLDGDAAQTLAYLRRLYMSLKELGLGDRLMVDLGLVQRNDYYTGVVFSGYVQERGGPVLTGGRYDSLCGRFGPPMPAAGFALDLDAAAALAQGDWAEEAPSVLVHGEAGYEVQAQRELARLAAEGVRAEASVWESLEEALAYAREADIERVLCLGAEPKEWNAKEARP